MVVPEGMAISFEEQSLLYWQKLHAHGFADLHRIAGLLGQTGFFIHLPDSYLCTVLTGNQHPFRTRVDVEVAGSLDVPGDVASGSQLPVFTHFENGNAVMPTVRNVNELAVRVEDALGGRVSLHRFRQRGKSLHDLVIAGSPSQFDNVHGRIELSANVSELGIGSDGNMPRSRTWRGD